jgi:hypothetical protein
VAKVLKGCARTFSVQLSRRPRPIITDKRMAELQGGDMRPSRIGRWFTALLLGTGLAGCKSSAPPSYPSDPLLVSKRPVEVKPQSAPPARVASADFVAPPSRVDLVAARTEPSRDHPTTAEPPLPPRPRPVSADPHEAAAASHPLSSPAVVPPKCP